MIPDKPEVDEEEEALEVNVYEEIYCQKKFEEVDIKNVTTFSQDNKFLFVASMFKEEHCGLQQYYQLKFYEFSNNEITNCQTFQSYLLKGRIIACLFLKNTNKAILGWESGSIELWEQLQNIWNFKQILSQPEKNFIAKQIIMNQAQDLMISPTVWDGTHFWIRSDDSYCISFIIIYFINGIYIRIKLRNFAQINLDLMKLKNF